MNKISEIWPGIATQGFRRNQIEWALWRTFHRLGQNAPNPTTQFTTRIKRLLDLDRHLEVAEGVDDRNHARHAYIECPPEGKGSDAQYLAVDGFCLAVGLDLLDIGLNQRDVVFLCRGVRHKLLNIFDEIVEGPVRDDNQLGNPNDYPDYPTYERMPKRLKSGSGNNQTSMKRSVDFGIFLMIRRIELISTLSYAVQNTLPADIPVFLEPELFSGSEVLGRRLALLRVQDRKAIVLELGFSATHICRWLSHAPIASRGRPKR